MKKLYQGAVGTGSGTLCYTVPTRFRTLIQDILISNTGSSDISFSLHLVPSGGSADTSNKMFPAVVVPQKTVIHWCGNQQLNSGDFVQAIGSASGIALSISGTDESVSI